MTTFIVLCKFEQAGIDGLLGDSSVAESPEQLMAEVGGNLVGLWFCIGVYDLVAVVEAPDTRKALAFLVAFSSLGRATTVTLAAESDVAGVLADARSARTNVGGPPSAETNIGGGEGETNIGGGGEGETNIGGGGEGETNIGGGGDG